MTKDYVSLHNHTTFSLMDSLIKPSELFKRVKELGQSAVGVTEHGSLASAWDCLNYSKEAGVKLIIGVEFNFTDDLANEDARLRHVILLAKNHEGYKNLLKISKLGYDNSIIMFKKVIPRIDWKIVEDNSSGLICTTACGAGILAQLLNTRRFDQAKQQAKRLKDIFGDNLAFEIQPHGVKRVANSYRDYEDQKFTNAQLIKLGKELDVKVIAATDAHYLTPDQHQAHDALLAIGSGQPIHSGNRLRYDAGSFHVKSRDEVLEFFAMYPQAEEFCDNTLYFADMCEQPEWIDPKYSNPSGKELPEFPVKKQSDYDEFKAWVNDKSDPGDDIALKALRPTIDMDDDKAYLRYAVYKNFYEMVPKGREVEYVERLNEEFDVIEYHNFSSYMLIVADYLDYCRKNDILTGYGRGCLTGDTKVLTDVGFKNLEDIKVNDNVFTHTGEQKKVTETFKYDIDEELLEIKLENSFGNIKLTKDHKIFSCRKTLETYKKKYKYEKKDVIRKSSRVKFVEPNWNKACDLNVGDYIYTTFPDFNNNEFVHTFDLSQFSKPELVRNDCIIVKRGNVNSLSIREISKKILNFEVIRKAKNNKLTDTSRLQILTDFLSNNNITYNEWCKIPKWQESFVKRYIACDDDFLYILGRWVGDGSLRSKYGINFSFNFKEKESIKLISDYFINLGFSCSSRKTNKNGFSVDVGGIVLSKLFAYIFPDYKKSSKTKHLPFFFRELSERQLLILLRGLFDSDGYAMKYCDTIKTTSVRLAYELKECFNKLKIVCGVHYAVANSNCGRNNSDSYLIRFSGLHSKKNTKYIYGNGYFSKILSIQKCYNNNVFDITVDDNKSYLTSSGVVHNSVGGSLIAHMIKIHHADSIKYGLIFARFHNKEKRAFPDCDCDFESTGKKIVEQYIKNKYGEDHVAGVSNVNTITPKVYARDIARAFQYGGDPKAAVAIGNAIADSIPKDIKTVNDALTQAPLFIEYANSEKYKDLKIYADYIGSKAKAWSTHAGGIVIGKRPLTDLVPLRRDKDKNIVLEYEKERAESNGLVKMDILGVSTLDVIRKTLKIIQEIGKPLPKNPPDFDEYDKKTYDLIQSGNTFCVFQLGTSAGTIDLCKKLKPKSIEDLAAINSLARPASKDIRQLYINAKNTGKDFEVIHPSLKNALELTHGFLIYDECLMQIGADVAGWDMNQADRLRKLTKDKGKHPEKVAKWQEEFIEDAFKNKGIDREMASRIWNEVIAACGSYTFNKSHAVFYSMLGFQTAQLKAYYPLEFLTANLIHENNSNALDADDKILKIKAEIRALKVKIIPPDINKSEATYKIISDNVLMTGFDSLKSIGSKAIPEILNKRPFTSFEDFLTKCDGSAVNSKSIQALAASGCLDSFGMTRRQMFLYAQDFKKKYQAWQKRKRKTGEFQYDWPKDMDEWSIPERFALERFYLGEGLSGNKFQVYSGFFNSSAPRFSEYAKMFPDTGEPNQHYPIGIFQAEIISFFEFKVKKEESKSFGKPMAKVLLEDPWGTQIFMTVFPKQWPELKKRVKALLGAKAELEPGMVIYGRGSLNWYEGDISIVFDDLLKCAMPPSLPKDMAPRKTSSSKKGKEEPELDLEQDDMSKDIEEELDELGFGDDDIDLEEESSTKDVFNS